MELKRYSASDVSYSLYELDCTEIPICLYCHYQACRHSRASLQLHMEFSLVYRV